MAVIGERCDRCKTINATGAPHTCWTRTVEQERADVVAWLKARFFGPETASYAPVDYAERIERGEHVGASSKEKKP